MRVVDTSAWIEWLTGSPLRDQLAAHIPVRSHCVFPTIIQLELAKWLARERGEERVDQMVAFTQKCVVVPVDTRIAMRSVAVHRQYKLATADAIVYATAQEYGADLVTCDAHFENLPKVILIRKH